MSAPVPAEPRKLLAGTVAAVLVAGAVLVGAVLPAEYGIDPTGFGRLTGFSRLSDAGAATPGVLVEPAEDGPRRLFALEARWDLFEVPVAAQEGYTSERQAESRVTIPIDVTNLTTLTARLDWTDADRIDGQPTEPDLFELSIRAPQGRRSQLVQAENVPGGAGNVTTTLAWRSAPFPVENASTGIHIPAPEEDRSAVGNWTFVIRLYGAGGLPNATAKDPGNNWTLTVTAEAYELSVEREAERAGDQVSLTLAPSAGVEYKFIMQPGGRLDYEWSSTAPVYWDLHAEEEGKDPDDFTRYREGTSDGEKGSLTAPFAGRHGWYWQNRGAESVTITLTTTGDYVILGVPPP